MRLIYKGFVLVGVPLILAVMVSGSMFALILQLDRDRAEEARHRQNADHACLSLLRAHDLMLCIHYIFSARDPRLLGAPDKQKNAGRNPDLSACDLKQRLKTDVAQLLALKRDAENPVSASSRPPSLQAFQREVDGLLDSIRALVRSTREQKQFAFDSLSAIDERRRQITCRAYDATRQARAINEASLQFQEKSRGLQKAIFALQSGVLLFGVIGSIVTGLSLAAWFMSNIAARLKTITDNTLRLAAGEELNPLLSGCDEIAALDKAFHVMADKLRQAMARDRALFDNASDIMCILDESARFTAVNPACLRLLGYPPEELLGHALMQFSASDDSGTNRASFEPALSGQPFQLFENRIKHKDGRDLDLLWSTYRSELDGAIYAVAHDITERKKTERLKQEFLQMVSHDLRGPLSSVFATYRLLESSAFGKLGEAASATISLVTSRVNQLISLVNDLLDIEKLEAGKLELAKEEAIVSDILQKAVCEVSPLTKQKGVSIAVESSCQKFVLDQGRIVQVIVNLLANAIKYSPEKSTVKLAAACESGILKVQVTDRGPGIAESRRKQIFQRFKQPAATDEGTGAGLGLPICKSIVEQHGGSMGVESSEGSGSSFWFTLPSETQAVESEPAKGTPEKAPAREAASGKKSRPALRRPGNFLQFGNIRLVDKGLLLVAIPVISELVFAGSLFPLLAQSYEEKQQELHQRLIVSTANNILLEHFMMGFSMSLRPWERSWQAFAESSQQAVKSERNLVALAASDARCNKELSSLLPIFQELNSLASRAKEIVDRFGVSETSLTMAYASREQMVSLSEQGISLFEQLIQRARPEANESPAKLQKLRTSQGLVLLGTLAISLVISGFSALLFTCGISRRLKVIENNMRHLQNGEPLPDSLPGRDEVAYLDGFLHSMASALSEATHKDRAVFENARDVICSISPGGDGAILRINPACERQWGYERAAIEGQSIFSRCPDNLVPHLAEALRQAAAGDSPCRIESTIITRQGFAVDVLWSLSWSQQEQAVIAIAHDISERKHLERLKQEFLSLVTYNMLTPLTSVIDETEILAEDTGENLPEAAAKLLKTSGTSCKRLLGLINDLLDMEKLESGQLQMSLRLSSAREILEKTAESLSSLAQAKNIGVSIDAPDTLSVEADSDRLVQVGVNLLSNAIKFSASGSSIHLSAKQLPDSVEFSVQDFGRGIPQAQLSAVFERYRQLEVADGKRRAGTGLGLSICKQIVEQHGGEIGVTSQEGHGSIFYFRIPSQAATALAVGQADISSEPAL